MRVIRRTWWANVVAYCYVAAIVMGLSFVTAPAQAAFELPPGEKITHAAVVARSIPDKEAYELYDPRIGKNFDLKKFWIRADLRVRYEFRNNTCFGSAMVTSVAAPVGNAACNSPNSGTTPNGTAGKANESFALQKTRLGFGYDISPDVNFYLELIHSAVWGGNGSQGTPLNDNQRTNSGATSNGFGNGGVLGVRAGYMLIRNFAGIENLSVKAGRQYVVFGNHSIFGAFDWSNTGFSFDGVMLQYNTKAWDSYYGWFRTSESDLGQGSPLGALTTNIPVTGGTAPPNNNNGSANIDSDVFIFYNQIKSVPGFVIEPYYILYSNRYNSGDNRNQGLGTPKHSNQTRHMVGNRIELRKDNFDAWNETIYQFGQMGDSNQPGCSPDCGNSKNLHISAWATRTWVGYTHYEWDWKPRLAFNFDYASGDGRANCTIGGNTDCKSANTFENLWGTNHIHMGYMDTIAWKNMMKPSINLQFRPTKDDHIEIWATSLNLANTKDNWYRAAQGVYVFSRTDNNKRHIGNELDIIWTRFFMDGKLSFQAGYGHLFAGAYIAENLGTSIDQDWAYAQLWVNF